MFFALELIGHPIILEVERKRWADDSDEYERALQILTVSFRLTAYQSKNITLLST